MIIEQRDVFLCPHPFDSKVEEHPFIVLSVRDSNEYERTFVAVMITSSDRHRDGYSFLLNDAMFEAPLKKKNSHVRMHLLTLCLNEEIKGSKANRMKVGPFNELL